MPIICPTVTATNQSEYQKQLADIATAANRIHIDVADGVFAPVQLLPPQNVYWPKEKTADIHVMYQSPLQILPTLIALQPQLIIVPVESPDAPSILTELKDTGIRRGLSIQQATPADALRPFMDQVEHVLIFSGDLGHFGGVADLSLLAKVQSIKNWKAEVEIGWDGGVKLDNIHELRQGGVDVLNVGGAIHNASDPVVAYEQLRQELSSAGERRAKA